MVLPVPSEMTATVGQILTAAEWNSNTRDGVNFLLNRPKARVYISGSFSLANGAWTQIAGGASTFTVDYDPYGLWNPSVNVFYLTSYPGPWRVHSRLEFPSNATGYRGVGFAWNSTSVDPNRESYLPANGIMGMEVNSDGNIPAGGSPYVRLMGYQSSGAPMSLTAQGEFSVAWLGPLA